jgi:ubiquinone/menaquinone biosynthesis C-methylase UbiE
MKWLKKLLKKIKFTWKCYKTGPRGVSSGTYEKYRPECTFDGKKVLNLGCGNSTFAAANVINLDAYQVPGVNLVWDLSKTPLPFEDETFDFIIANHILEHVPDWWECFKDLARIVKIGGTIEVWLPGDGTSSQLGYRDHINVINYCSFVGIRGTQRNLANAWELKDRQTNGYIGDFEGSCRYLSIDYWWTQFMSQSMLKWVTTHLRNVVAEQGWFFKRLPPKGEK